MSDTAPRNHAGLRRLGVRHLVLGSTAGAWLPVVAWAALIFALSSVPDLGTGLGGWDLLLRKLAHTAEYAVFGVLLARATRRPGLAITLGLLYAASDELHQAFVRGREGSPVDVVIDAVGVACGVLLWLRWRAGRPRVTPSKGVAIDLDGALGDTRPLWNEWLASAGALLGVEAAELSADRGVAAAELDHRGAGNWRVLLQRFSEERAPVFLRRDAVVSASLRTLTAAGCELGVFTDAPEPLARVALAQLGAARRVSVLETGSDALHRVLEKIGRDAVVVRTRADLEQAST